MKKILVIGGAYQGKTKWAEENYPEYEIVSPEKLWKENVKGNHFDGIFLNGFHLILKQWMEQGRDCKEAVALLRKNPSWLIVSDEIGNGIVPIKREDRQWREHTGRALCELAKDADEVYRIQCGIPVKIKGGGIGC